MAHLTCHHHTHAKSARNIFLSRNNLQSHVQIITAVFSPRNYEAMYLRTRNYVEAMYLAPEAYVSVFSPRSHERRDPDPVLDRTLLAGAVGAHAGLGSADDGA